MRRLALFIMLMVCSAVAAGCAGARETDEIAYVLAIGLDKGDEPGKIRVTYQIAVPRTLAGGSQAGGGKSDQSSVLITLEAPSLAEARNLLNSAVSRIPNLSHTKVFIFGEEIARAGVADVLGPLMRFREFRGSMFVMIANEDTAQHFMEKNKPKLEILTSRFYENMLLGGEETSYYLRTNLHDFYLQYKTGNMAPIAVLAGAPKEEENEEAPVRQARPPARADEYVGHTPRVKSTETAAEALGTAVFVRDRMVGKLTNQETRMMAILTNQFRRGFLVFDDPLEPEKIVHVNARLGEPTKIAVNFVDGRPVIDISVFLEGEITSISSGINYEQQEYRSLLEAQVSRLIERETGRTLHKLQSLGADVIGFGYRARRHFATWQEWQAFDWAAAYQQATFRVQVKTEIRRHGLMWRTSPVK
ncbi:Ger(x)C family spore germination protein [Sporolituus thermophilus]|uniref:Spore germination B3/ GerAC like, C-terminal n=1 Tax=Sporolituus thermophilus DSM 23256 TaxID=1123285 RepID=A0A1G7JYQ6_9FIRM|nr:Ger(x)C family spore germination protein [Sporolituus thermophilus]SDF30047.1 Spore germination B3/ GerAC like, C-terminal [Sporolituus thermophilus DSM 23256]